MVLTVKTSKKDGTLTKEKLDKVHVTLLGDQYQFKRKVANNKYVGKKVNFVYNMRWDQPPSKKWKSKK